LAGGVFCGTDSGAIFITDDFMVSKALQENRLDFLQINKQNCFCTLGYGKKIKILNCVTIDILPYTTDVLLVR